jgi:hypothetical protein
MLDNAIINSPEMSTIIYNKPYFKVAQLAQYMYIMYYYDNDDNDLYYDLEKMFNDELDQKDESEEFSKFFSE